MHNISECKMLLRAHTKLPFGFRFTIEEFREGWDLMRTGNAAGLQRKTATHGWTFVKSDISLLQGGVGETSQLAIASAVKLALRRVDEHFNATEIDYIELTHYPWFFLARVRVCLYSIQKNAELTVYDFVAPRSTVLKKKYSPLSPSHSYFDRTMPQLRQTLAVSRNRGKASSQSLLVQTAQP